MIRVTRQVRGWGLVAMGAAAAALTLALPSAVTLHAVRALSDEGRVISEQRLGVALQTFRPSEKAGRAYPVPAADLAPERAVRSDPERCAPLVLLGTGTPAGAASWSGVNGAPVEPVTTLTVRYDDAAAARAAFDRKRVALLRCRALRLDFPPFDQPIQTFTVAARGWRFLLTGDRLAYTLGGERLSYAFYVRRYGNTLTWTYHDTDYPVGPAREVVDDLAARLSTLRPGENG